MPATGWGWVITPEELPGWILSDSPDLLVLNKPPHVVCHPSRHGPWSSLVGACREYLGAKRLHMPFRLDRETSGVMVFARTKEAGARLHRAVYNGRFHKTYHAVLCGRLPGEITVTGAIGLDPDAEFFARRKVVETGGDAAETRFIPLAEGGGYTLARVEPRTGRRHQIRVHAAWLGHPLAGDKLYGDDPSAMIELIRSGFPDELAGRLVLPRHGLHCSRVEFHTRGGAEIFDAPAPEDLAAFCRERMGVGAEGWTVARKMRAMLVPKGAAAARAVEAIGRLPAGIGVQGAGGGGEIAEAIGRAEEVVWLLEDDFASEPRIERLREIGAGDEGHGDGRPGAVTAGARRLHGFTGKATVCRFAARAGVQAARLLRRYLA